MPTYEYFISFNAMTPDGAMTCGNLSLQLPALVTSFEHIQSLERFLRNQGHQNAIVLGYHHLRTIEPQS